MKTALLGLGLGILVATMWHASTEPKQVSAQRLPLDRQSTQKIIALQGPQTEGSQLLVLIDTEEATIGSYHIDPQSGQVALRCVRRFGWDLQMDEYNGVEPSPEHIKALIRSR